jgi:hypothetical protein
MTKSEPTMYEQVVTPAVLQQRERDELESVNERGQILLSTKKIGTSSTSGPPDKQRRDIAGCSRSTPSTRCRAKR